MWGVDLSGLEFRSYALRLLAEQSCREALAFGNPLDLDSYRVNRVFKSRHTLIAHRTY